MQLQRHRACYYAAGPPDRAAQKADQILLPPDMQQRPLVRPLQIALGYSHNIYSYLSQYCADMNSILVYYHDL